jgi:hypothetical protein
MPRVLSYSKVSRLLAREFWSFQHNFCEDAAKLFFGQPRSCLLIITQKTRCNLLSYLEYIIFPNQEVCPVFIGVENSRNMVSYACWTRSQKAISADEETARPAGCGAPGCDTSCWLDPASCDVASYNTAGFDATSCDPADCDAPGRDAPGRDTSC